MTSGSGGAEIAPAVLPNLMGSPSERGALDSFSIQQGLHAVCVSVCMSVCGYYTYFKTHMFVCVGILCIFFSAYFMIPCLDFTRSSTYLFLPSICLKLPSFLQVCYHMPFSL